MSAIFPFDKRRHQGGIFREALIMQIEMRGNKGDEQKEISGESRMDIDCSTE
jgi:hypothetical protein